MVYSECARYLGVPTGHYYKNQNAKHQVVQKRIKRAYEIRRGLSVLGLDEVPTTSGRIRTSK